MARGDPAAPWQPRSLPLLFLWFSGAAFTARGADVPLSASGKPLVDEMPLRTSGRYVIGKSGERVKLACVNWYGAHSSTYVVGGLEVRPLMDIVRTIVDLGFNCVRLPYVTQGQLENPLIEDRFLKANPQFRGMRFYDVFDATISALTGAGLMVIPNNQRHKAGWCCYWKQQEGLWYVPGYPASVWVESVANITRRYKANPMVVGIDLRNEPHDWEDTELTWGTGTDSTDLAAASTMAGNAVLAENPNVLVIIEGLCFGMELRPVRHYPIELDVAHRVVYQAHNYLEFNPLSAFSEVVMSWQEVGSITAGVLVGTGILFALSLRTWCLLGWPRASPRSLASTVGLWIFLYSLLGVTICAVFAMQLRQLPGCGYWARRDLRPPLYVFISISCLAFAYMLWAMIFSRRFAYQQRSRCLSFLQPCLLLETKDSVRARFRPSSEGRRTETEESDSSESTEDDTDPEDVRKEMSRRPSSTAPGFASWRVAAKRWKALLCKRRHDGAAAAPVAVHAEECGPTSALNGDRAPAASSSVRAEPRGSPEVSASAAPLPPVAWDRGLICGLHCSICLCTFFLGALCLNILAFLAPGYAILAWGLDQHFGFLLEDGQNWTAPVWLGEFGSSVPGHYWSNIAQYVNDRDMDFAYWALNGRKYTEGYIDVIRGGKWVDTKPHWDTDIFGILESDYKTVRYPWMMLDLRALQMSPAQWRPPRPACNRWLIGPACGG